jgi:peptidoglycan/LPS O-acetylase OafA/YrhL
MLQPGRNIASLTGLRGLAALAVVFHHASSEATQASLFRGQPMVDIFFTLSGFVFACSGIFQALGNTWPGVWASATRLVTFVLPAMWLSSRPGFRIEHIWYASVTTVFLQAAVAGWLVRREFGRRLKSA